MNYIDSNVLLCSLILKNATLLHTKKTYLGRGISVLCVQLEKHSFLTNAFSWVVL